MFTHIDISFDVTCEGHENWVKISFYEYFEVRGGVNMRDEGGSQSQLLRVTPNLLLSQNHILPL